MMSDITAKEDISGLTTILKTHCLILKISLSHTSKEGQKIEKFINFKLNCDVLSFCSIN